MNELFDKVKEQASKMFPDIFAQDDVNRVFILRFENFTMVFLAIDDVELYVRAHICTLTQLTDNDELFEEFLQGNLFYSGTGGGTLGINGPEGAEELYLTERMPIAALEGGNDMMEYCDKFLATADYWKERCTLYLPPGTPLAESADASDDAGTGADDDSQGGLDMNYFRGMRI